MRPAETLRQIGIVFFRAARLRAGGIARSSRLEGRSSADSRLVVPECAAQLARVLTFVESLVGNIPGKDLSAIMANHGLDVGF